MRILLSCWRGNSVSQARFILPGAATGLPGYSFFFFFFLMVIKRHAEENAWPLFLGGHTGLLEMKYSAVCPDPWVWLGFICEEGGGLGWDEFIYIYINKCMYIYIYYMCVRGRARVCLGIPYHGSPPSYITNPRNAWEVDGRIVRTVWDEETIENNTIENDKKAIKRQTELFWTYFH